MSAPRKFRLFNCDHVYKLDSIEDLLMAITAKPGFEFSVEKHYFPLSGISELSNKTIPELQIDFAVLAVHANESSLTINEDTGGGYTEVYRALLKATEDKVIVVIGGDDNYKNETEEEQSVISRWAWKKIARSQFKEEFIDGRKSFVFSWDKKHRAIHEEAMLHFFDPSKKGQKFDYQPRKVDLPPDPVAAKEVVISNSDERTREDSQELPLSQKNVTQKEKVDAFLNDHSGSLANGKAQKAVIRHNEKGAQAGKKVPFESDEDLVVCGCNVSAESMQTVRQVIEDIRPRLNMSRYPPVTNSSPVDIKSYLMRTPPRFCVLVVDTATLRNDCDHSPQLKLELEELVRTAAEKVVEKVIFTICGPSHLPSKDEEMFVQTIESILKERGKGLPVWLEDGKLNVEPDVLIQLMLQTSTMDDTGTRKSYQEEFSRPANVASASIPETSQAKLSQEHLTGPLVQEPYHDTRPRLDKEQHDKPSQALLPAPTSYEEPPMGYNEALMLKTRIRNGKISFEPGDLEFRYPDWMIPQYLVESLGREYSGTPEGELCVISDEKGNLRSTVKVARMHMTRCLLV
ncbi:hypothetical protein ACROYT_G027461 [Oculina patagonica]